LAKKEYSSRISRREIFYDKLRWFLASFELIKFLIVLIDFVQKIYLMSLSNSPLYAKLEAQRLVFYPLYSAVALTGMLKPML